MTSSIGQLNKLLKCHKFFNQFQRSVANHADNARVLDLEVCKGQGNCYVFLHLLIIIILKKTDLMSQIFYFLQYTNY